MQLFANTHTQSIVIIDVVANLLTMKEASRAVPTTAHRTVKASFSLPSCFSDIQLDCLSDHLSGLTNITFCIVDETDDM